MFFALHIFFRVLLVVPFIMAAYLLFLTVSAVIVTFISRKKGQNENNEYIFVIPAYNEEKLIHKTLDNLLKEVEYDKSKFEVIVIADNCTDKTAEISRSLGATVLERNNDQLKGKGYALEWGLEQCWAQGKSPDAVIILDADTVVSANFLHAIDDQFSKGHQVIQSFYSVLNPTESWSAGLRYAALSVLHFVRPQGRSLYGGSAGLKGNGMVFATDIIKNHNWSSSLTEDIEFHMSLLLEGTKVHFAPDAVVWAEMPNSIEDANSQNERWESGRLEMAKKYVPELIRAAILPKQGQKRNAIPQLDAVMEHVIPPFAIFNGISLILIVVGSILFFIDRSAPLAQQNFFVALAILMIQIVYLLSGLILTKAPAAVYKNLLRAPFYVLWKIMLVFRIFSNKTEDDWIRTARNES